jgi:hypothetical protein
MTDRIQKIYQVVLKPAKCGLDLGDGSERAEYVNQDYILQTLGRPHRNINIMYTYYPKDKEWPQRISEACKDMEIHFQWDYPYDDYFPYEGGINGSTAGQPFEQMRDIRRHGQDVTLTLTIDCSLSDEYLRAIARDLRPFGRMRLRINHECSGDWFTHNQRFSYQEIGDFFVRFCRILKEEAPNILTVFCAGAVMDFSNSENTVQYEKEFTKAYQTADIWSMDCYLALHYGWPFDICEKGTDSYAVTPVETYYERLERSAKRFAVLNHGEKRPLVVSEFNTDGDVTGPFHQAEGIKRFLQMLKDNHAEEWFGGFSLYQFRDRGRLGLEIEDPNNSSVGIAQPLLKEYKEILKDSYFMPQLETREEISLPVTMRWGGAEDAEGIALAVTLDKTPEFFEIVFEEELNLMLSVNGRWFYKAPATERIDLMPAFFENLLEGPQTMAIYIFAPPASGENDASQGADWAENYYCTMHTLPKLRIRYEAAAQVR